MLLELWGAPGRTLRLELVRLPCLPRYGLAVAQVPQSVPCASDRARSCRPLRCLLLLQQQPTLLLIRDVARREAPGNLRRSDPTRSPPRQGWSRTDGGALRDHTRVDVLDPA